MLARFPGTSSELPVRRGEHARIPTKFNALVVVALVVFFFGLVFWRVPVDGYDVVATIGRDRPIVTHSEANSDAVAQSRDEAPDNAVALLSDRNTIGRAIRHANASTAGDVTGVADSIPSRRIDTVLAKLEIRPTASDLPSDRYEIRYRGVDPDWAIAFVNQLVETFLLQKDSATQEKKALNNLVRAARWRVDETRHYERKARFEFEAWLNRWLELVAGGEWQQLDVARLIGRRDADEDRSEDQPTTQNPIWVGLQHRLVELKRERQTLLVDHTANHPRVEDVLLRIEEVQTELNNTSEFIDATPTAGRSAASEIAWSGTATAVTGAEHNSASTAGGNNGESLADEYTRLKQCYDDLCTQRADAEQALAELQLHRDAVADSLAESQRRTIASAAITRQIGGRPSGRQIGVLGLLAIACGVLMAWTVGTLKGLKNVNTVDEIGQLLGIPVVGQLSIDPTRPSVGRLAKRAWLVRWTTTACECSLGLLIVVFVIGALDGSSALANLRDNPFGAIGRTVADVCGGWF